MRLAISRGTVAVCECRVALIVGRRPTDGRSPFPGEASPARAAISLAGVSPAQRFVESDALSATPSRPANPWHRFVVPDKASPAESIVSPEPASGSTASVLNPPVPFASEVCASSGKLSGGSAVAEWKSKPAVAGPAPPCLFASAALAARSKLCRGAAGAPRPAEPQRRPHRQACHR